MAPQLAGLFAILVNANGGTSADFGPQVVFCLAQNHITMPTAFNDFNDITSGTNSPGAHGLGGTFNAAAGWDHPTGWGSPNAANFVTDAKASCP